MAALVLSEAEVTEHLDMAACIEAMADVLAARARGEAHMPLRSVVRGEGSAGLLGLMPAYRGGTHPAYSLKAVCIFTANPRLGLDAHQGIVTLFDGETGKPTAVLNGSAVTSIRTAAVTALATRLLAPAAHARWRWSARACRRESTSVRSCSYATSSGCGSSRRRASTRGHWRARPAPSIAGVAFEAAASAQAALEARRWS